MDHCFSVCARVCVCVTLVRLCNDRCSFLRSVSPAASSARSSPPPCTPPPTPPPPGGTRAPHPHPQVTTTNNNNNNNNNNNIEPNVVFVGFSLV